MGALTDDNNMGWLELTLKHHTVIMDMRFFRVLWWAVHLLFVFSLSELILYVLLVFLHTGLVQAKYIVTHFLCTN